jgi:pyrroline-5-carboxylate reductase
MSDSIEIAFAGAGQMGEALIKGLVQVEFYRPEQILAADVLDERQAHMQSTYGIQVTSNCADLPARCRNLVLAVKPQDVDAVVTEWSPNVGEEHLIMSIAAGISVGHLERRLRSRVRVIRVMPNTPSLLQMGCSAVAPGLYADRADIDLAHAIFSAVGKVVEVDNKLMDAITGLSGTGPAYIYIFAEALIDAGVRMGIPRPIAKTLVIQTMKGAAEMIDTTGNHPAALRDQVASPGGTTLAAMAVLDRGGFRALVYDAVEAAAQRSKELGEAMQS